MSCKGLPNRRTAIQGPTVLGAVLGVKMGGFVNIDNRRDSKSSLTDSVADSAVVMTSEGVASSRQV